MLHISRGLEGLAKFIPLILMLSCEIRSKQILLDNNTTNVHPWKQEGWLNLERSPESVSFLPLGVGKENGFRETMCFP
jgi:hypothetical protein